MRMQRILNVSEAHHTITGDTITLANGRQLDGARLRTDHRREADFTLGSSRRTTATTATTTTTTAAATTAPASRAHAPAAATATATSADATPPAAHRALPAAPVPTQAPSGPIGV